MTKMQNFATIQAPRSLVVACDLARLLSIVVATQSTEAEHSSVVSHKVPLNPLLWSTRATTAEGGRVLCVGRRRRASEQTLADQKTHRRGEEWHKNIRESSRRRNLQDFFPLPLCALSAQTNNRKKIVHNEHSCSHIGVSSTGPTKKRLRSSADVGRERAQQKRIE